MTVASCPNCNTALADIHQTDIVKSEPAPGDLHFCGECATISRYVTPHLIEKLTPEKLQNFSDEELSDIKFAVRCILSRTKQKQDLEQAKTLALAGKRFNS